MRVAGVRSVNLLCRTARRLGPEIANPSRLPAVVASHVRSCLRCQADAVRYRRLRRELGSLADRIEAAPPFLLTGVEQAISAQLASSAGSRQHAHLAATIAGTAAAAASAVAVAMWRRARAAV